MKRVELLNSVINLLKFKTMSDEFGNEYVFFADQNIDLPIKIDDKTEFEAFQNHIHLLECVKKSEFNKLVIIGMELGRILAESLKFHYPQKHFIVFISISVKDSMIVRFHQKWKGEDPYYNPEDFNSDNEKVIMVAT